jgi:hypothetical protein
MQTRVCTCVRTRIIRRSRGTPVGFNEQTQEKILRSMFECVQKFHHSSNSLEFNGKSR